MLTTLLLIPLQAYKSIYQVEDEGFLMEGFLMEGFFMEIVFDILRTYLFFKL